MDHAMKYWALYPDVTFSFSIPPTGVIPTFFLHVSYYGYWREAEVLPESQQEVLSLLSDLAFRSNTDNAHA